METRKLGRSGLEVPAVGMGTYRTFDVSGTRAETHCTRIVDTALEAGTNLFDSSPMYGEAERVLALTAEGRRKKAIIATKVWSTSVQKGRRQIERALAWYGNYVNIYQIHNLASWREHLPYLEDLKEQGKIGVIGVTHYSRHAFSELIEVMQTGRIQQIQIPYNIADREVENEVLPLAHELEIGVLVMRPLDQGMLVRRSPPIEKQKVLSRFGVETWAQALLKWILSDLRVSCAIPATRKVERVKENAGAGSAPWFDRDVRDYVQKLFDTHC